ncbi:T9SS C-terminal target domain-containing protein [uncultured Fibrobacter sp.]|uniref:T9SS C-terminal target domain-containing protein n=1 Tax=uncultured Fibrobacter sp. TaxID=261512 RepID=UPI0025DF3646|nr:T9SS C-terminal target domain-containing protein [uncultured Fibrobacter sp.]
MKKNFYCGLAAFMVLAFTACSDDSAANAVEQPIALDSSSSIAESSVSECRDLIWFGNDPEEGVRVPVETCAESSWPKNVVADGVWRIMETDGEDGGKSSIVWPVEFVDGIDTMAAVKDSCYGICGTAALDKGSLTYNPFVSIGFTLARDGSGNPVPVDVSNWGGICIVYTSEIAPALELDLGDSVNKVLDYALPSAVLMKSSVAANIKCIPWSAFEIPSWFKGDDHGWKNDTGAKAAKQLVGVRIRLQDKPQDGGYKFYVSTISAYNSGSGLYAAGPADQ